MAADVDAFELFTVAESIEFFEGIASHAQGWIQTLKNEL